MHAAYNRAVADAKKPGRVLALDVGNRRIGLAVTDELGLTVLGLRTLERTSKRHDLEVLRKIVRKHGVEEVVVGKPMHMSGDSSAQGEKVAAFAAALHAALELPVHLVDERLTSWQAEQILDERGVPGEKRKGKVDEIAAVLILESYLESRRR